MNEGSSTTSLEHTHARMHVRTHTRAHLCTYVPGDPTLPSGSRCSEGDPTTPHKAVLRALKLLARCAPLEVEEHREGGQLTIQSSYT